MKIAGILNSDNYMEFSLRVLSCPLPKGLRFRSSRIMPCDSDVDSGN